jgi:hypothetical protein
MTTPRGLPRSKRFYIFSTTLAWAIPMSIFSLAWFWKLGALSFDTALALILLATATGVGFATTMYQFVKRKVGPAKDD